MNKDQDREDRALDALIAAALRQEPCAEEDLRRLRAASEALTPEDRQALDALGSDLVARILAGTWGPQHATPEEEGEAPEQATEDEVAGAMHRGDEGGEVTEAAREEMERKLRELEGEDESQP